MRYTIPILSDIRHGRPLTARRRAYVKRDDYRAKLKAELRRLRALPKTFNGHRSCAHVWADRIALVLRGDA